MIPQFPEFKKLELSDKTEIERFNEKYPPYSDFNFVSMWSWDVKEEMQISTLNGNLVVRFTDYLTGEPLYSFIGLQDVDKTVSKLLEFTLDNGLKPRLALVPEITAKNLNSVLFKIEEDRDNFDYIYDLNAISELKGGNFLSQRNKVNSFKKKYPNAIVKLLDVHDPKVKQQILDLEEDWLENKAKKDISFKFKNELLATNRFIDSGINDILAVGIMIDDTLIAYCIEGVLEGNYAISHFSKADIDYTGIYEYLLVESAKIMKEHDKQFLNYEQDLGLPGLRNNKKSFVSNYLKKYIVSFAD